MGDAGSEETGTGGSAGTRPFGRALRIGFALDVKGYGGRSVPQRDEVQERLSQLVTAALATCGNDLNLQVVDHQWNGDGINALLPTYIDPTAVVPVLVRSLAAGLRLENARQADRMRLRMAVGVGLSEARATGYGGPMIMEISRLVDSAALRSALDQAPDADLAVAVSDSLYSLVIKAGYPGLPEGQFTPVTAVSKEFSETAWIWLSTRQWSTPAYEPLRPDDPREVGEYRLVARIGAGQAGQVYLASAEAPPAVGAGAPGGSREWAAVKVFDPALTANPDVERRLSVGILGGKVLPGGPNLTRVLAPRELERPLWTESPAWVASTLVRGPSLAAAISETGPLPADATGWLAVTLARAVATAHLVPLAHQSVCPHNVLLDAGGPVLTDWGLNRTALVNGPGDIAADAAADVLMLAATVCYAATGRPPWGEQVDGLADVRDRPSDSDIDLSGCPAALRPLLAECLAADPAARPTAAAALSRLTAMVGRQPQSWLPGPVSARIAEYQTLPPFPRGRLRWPR
jgi:hypothetical protein